MLSIEYSKKKALSTKICGFWDEKVRKNILKCTENEKSVTDCFLFRCAKRSILPSKAETSGKAVRSFYGQNSTAQSHKKQSVTASSFLQVFLLYFFEPFLTSAMPFLWQSRWGSSGLQSIVSTTFLYTFLLHLMAVSQWVLAVYPQQFSKYFCVSLK